jgi:hypothetical protein
MTSFLSAEERRRSSWKTVLPHALVLDRHLRTFCKDDERKSEKLRGEMEIKGDRIGGEGN